MWRLPFFYDDFSGDKGLIGADLALGYAHQRHS